MDKDFWRDGLAAMLVMMIGCMVAIALSGCSTRRSVSNLIQARDSVVMHVDSMHVVVYDSVRVVVYDSVQIRQSDRIVFGAGGTYDALTGKATGVTEVLLDKTETGVRVEETSQATKTETDNVSKDKEQTTRQESSSTEQRERVSGWWIAVWLALSVIAGVAFGCFIVRKIGL